MTFFSFQQTVEAVKQSAFGQISAKSAGKIGTDEEVKNYSSWHVMQRAMLRLHIIAEKSKNQVRLGEAQKQSAYWKERFYELKKAADEMQEQFEIEKDAQNEIINEYYEKFEEVAQHRKKAEPITISQGRAKF